MAAEPPGPPPSDAPPETPAGEEMHAEMHAAPPFATWRAIYAVVLIALGAQVALYAALTAIYR